MKFHAFIKKAALSAIFASGAIAAYANGDPVTRISALERSANPAPRTITDIHVIREELRIKPGLYTEVSVRYYLWNSSGKDYENIDYAFPVDYQGFGDKLANSALIGDDYSESSAIYGWRDDYIRDVVFSANGAPLPFEISQETAARKPKEPVVQDPEDIENLGPWTKEQAELAYACQTTGRKWFYTRFHIDAGETMVLDVRYSLRNQASMPAYENIDRRLNSTFTYDLAPAKHWGDGIAREIEIRIDLSVAGDVWKGYYNDWTSDYMYPGLDGPSPVFREDRDKDGNGSGDLVFRAKNFDFSKAKPIYFGYSVYSGAALEDWLPYRIGNDRYTVSVSSENKAYPASNLSDMNLETAWAIPWKDGDRPVITIKFNEPVKLGAILLAPGYYKSEKTFYENARPREISGSAKVLEPENIYDEKTDKYLFTGRYRNDSEDFQLLQKEGMGKYEVLTFNNLMEDAMILQKNIWSNSLVTELTISINEIVPGTTYNDLCVTELILLDDNIFLTKRFGRGIFQE